MARCNLLVHVVESLVDVATGRLWAQEPPPRRAGARPHRGRWYPGRVRAYRPPTVEVHVQITHSPTYFQARAGLAPTRVLPTARIRPIGSPAHRSPRALPGSANAAAVLVLSPASPDGPASSAWPPPDA